MSNPIEDRVGKRIFRPVDLFNNMTDDDLMYVHYAGQLYSLCMALSVDLQNSKNEKNHTFQA